MTFSPNVYLMQDRTWRRTIAVGELQGGFTMCDVWCSWHLHARKVVTMIYNITGLGISHVDLNIRVLIYVQVAVQIKIVKSIIRLNRVVWNSHKTWIKVIVCSTWYITIYGALQSSFNLLYPLLPYDHRFTIIGGHNRAVWLYLLRDKAEAHKYLTGLCSLVHNQFNQYNGMEFLSKESRDFFLGKRYYPPDSMCRHTPTKLVSRMQMPTHLKTLPVSCSLRLHF